MTQDFKFAHRKARVPALLLAALLFTLASCNSTDLLNTDNTTDPGAIDGGTVSDGGSGVPSFATAYAGGIPMGTWALPTSWFGSPYNGAMRNIWPNELRAELAAIKSRGGKVILSLAGKETNYRDSDHHFSMTKWKERVSRFRQVDFSSFIQDGTIIGHYLIDEPNDPANWGGRPVPGSTVEEMAKYSKQLWPGMAAVVRVEPSYLLKWSGYHYLDAAWAQYVSRKGAPDDFIRRNVSDAQKLGLALVTGLNILKGGNNGSKMTASQVKTWGSALLNSSYPCAFISWSYNSTYLSSSGIKDAMRYLRSKAQNRSFKTCKS